MMKRFYTASICLLLFISTAFAGNYEEFVKAWGEKNYPKALQFIEKAYAEKPGDMKNVYWYAMALYQNQQYQETAVVLKKLPQDYDPLKVNWYIGDCLLKTGQLKESVSYFLNALSAPDNDKKFKQSVYVSLIDSYIKVSNTQGLSALSGDYSIYIKANPEINAAYMNYRFASYFQGIAIHYGTNGNLQNAAEWNKKSAQIANYGMGKYSKYFDPFGYAYGFVKAKQFQTAYDLFQKASVTNPGLKYLWNYNETLINLGYTNRAIELLKTGLKTYQKSDNDAQWLTPLYANFMVSCAYTKNVKDYEEMENTIFSFYASKPNPYFYWGKFAIARMYLNLGFQYTGTKDAVKWLKKSISIAESGLDKFQGLYRLQDVKVLLDAEQFWQQYSTGKLPGAYKMKFLFWVWGESSGKWTDGDGNTKTVNKKFNPGDTNEILMNFKVFRTVYFYFTGGEVLPEMELVLLTNCAVGFSQITNNTKLKGADGKPIIEMHAWRPVDGTNLQYPWKLLATNINNYDVFVSIFPFDIFCGFAVYGQLQIVPLIKSGAYRGGFVMTDEAVSQPWTMIHEFFHNIESIYREPVKAKVDLSIHIYKDSFKKYWPAWYKGQGELFYYNYIFKNYLKDKGYQLLHLKETLDTTPLEKYEQYWGYFKKSNFPVMWEAFSLKTKGIGLYVSGDIQKARQFLEKSFLLFPYFYDNIDMLGKIYYKDKVYDKALKYLLIELELGETNQSILTMTAFCYEQTGELDKALDMQLLAYQDFGKKTVNLYFAAKLLYTMSKYTESAGYLEKLVSEHLYADYWQNAVNLLANIYTYKLIDYKKVMKLFDSYYKDIKLDYLIKDSSICYAIALGETGNKKAALKYLEKAKQYGAAQKTLDYYIKKYSK
jgi:tetratricopeptide (TPR) repeat protein